LALAPPTNRRKPPFALLLREPMPAAVEHPAADIKGRPRREGGGVYTLTDPRRREFIEHHKIGSKAVLSARAIVFSRRAAPDMVDLGKQQPRRLVRYSAKKTPLQAPVHVAESRSCRSCPHIAASPCGS